MVTDFQHVSRNILPHLKTPFLIHLKMHLPNEAFQVWKQEIGVVAVAQVLKVAEAEWAKPYEMELGYSFYSLGATPEIERLLW